MKLEFQSVRYTSKVNLATAAFCPFQFQRGANWKFQFDYRAESESDRDIHESGAELHSTLFSPFVDINKGGVSLLKQIFPKFGNEVVEPVALLKRVHKNAHREEHPAKQLSRFGPFAQRQAKFYGFFLIHGKPFFWLR